MNFESSYLFESSYTLLALVLGAGGKGKAAEHLSHTAFTGLLSRQWESGISPIPLHCITIPEGSVDVAREKWKGKLERLYEVRDGKGSISRNQRAFRSPELVGSYSSGWGYSF